MRTGQQVKPRIEEIEQRIQFRSPKGGPAAAHHQSAEVDAENASAALVLRTPQQAENGNANITAMTPHNPSKFAFLSAEKPGSGIKQFEADVIQKQAQYSRQINEMEARLATFHMRLADESLERERELSNTVEDYVYEPIGQAMKRSLDRIEHDFIQPVLDPKRALPDEKGEDQEAPELMVLETDNAESTSEEDVAENDDDGNGEPAIRTNLVKLERQTHHLEARMNHHEHVTLFNSKRVAFDAIEQQCRKSIQPAIQLEKVKANEREAKIIRNFESSVGSVTRHLAEMQAARSSSLGYIEQQLDAWELDDVVRMEGYLKQIQAMKRQVLEEREERRRQDEVVVEKILHAKKMLEQDLFTVI